MMKKKRKSNIEILRLICMFFVLIHHTIVHVFPLTESVSTPSFFLKLLDTLAYCAVPVFVLISGYFGVRPSLKGFLSLYTQCAFYQFILTLSTLCLNCHGFGKWMLLSADVWATTLMPFTHSPWWWFMTTYICLYLLSPILNTSILSLDRNKYIGALLLLTIVNVYFGWRFDAERMLVNHNGYCVMNFIYLYFIGRFIALYVKKGSLKVSWCFGVYLSASLLAASLSFSKISWRWTDTYPYNHPLILVASIAFFLCFVFWNYQNDFVNWAASSSLSIYLIHSFYGFAIFVYPLAASLIDYLGLLNLVVYPLLILLFMFCCIWIDKLRIYLTSELVELITIYIQKKLCQKFQL